MSFQRLANRLLLGVLVGLPALGFAASLVPTLPRALDSTIPVLFVIFVAAAAAGVTLPAVSTVLDRFDYGRETHGGTVRRAGLGMAALLAMLGAATTWLADGPGRLAGGALLLAACAAFLLAWTHRPDDSRVGPRPGFGSALLGCVVFAIAIMMPRYYGTTRTHAYERAMISDLRNMQTTQRMHFDSLGVYSADPTVGGEYRTSTGVHVSVRLTTDGWAAVATHAVLEGRCALFEGSAPEPPATEPGIVGCDTEGPSETGRIMAALSLLALCSAAVLAVAGMIAGRHSRDVLGATG